MFRFLTKSRHHGNHCDRPKTLRHNAVMNEASVKEATNGVDMEIQEVVTPAGNHPERHADKGPSARPSERRREFEQF